MINRLQRKPRGDSQSTHATYKISHWTLFRKLIDRCEPLYLDFLYLHFVLLVSKARIDCKMACLHF